MSILGPRTLSRVHERCETSFGGSGRQYLARGGMHKVYEGDWEPRRIVLLEFPTFKAWEAFYKGPTYQGLKAIREAPMGCR
jgi:uncharacterized protein (DUF1330 family)